MVIKDFIPEDALFQPLEFGETKGLTDEEAAERLRRDGPNEIVREHADLIRLTKTFSVGPISSGFGISSHSLYTDTVLILSPHLFTLFYSTIFVQLFYSPQLFNSSIEPCLKLSEPLKKALKIAYKFLI